MFEQNCQRVCLYLAKKVSILGKKRVKPTEKNKELLVMRLVSQLLMVCDGNYYLLAYNPKSKREKVRMYRVDRMKDVKRIRGSEREGF